MRLPIVAALFVLSVMAAIDYPEDPYAILGVSRKATAKEIKSAYKALAKEWHPDKNSSPDASERFMEISKSYEVLSDPLKKERYDMFGSFDETATGRHGGSHHGFDHGFGFGGYENGFFGNHKISMRLYVQSILEKSNEQPFIIFAYSNYCHLCFRLQHIWKSAVSDLEPLGYGIGTVNALTDGNLLEKLRVSQLPSIVAVVEGRVVPLRHNMLHITDRTIRQFAQKVIPNYFVTKINSQAALTKFIEQWRTTNKVSVVILGAAVEARTRYLLAAMKFASYARFAYVHLGEQSSEMERIKEALSIKCTKCENILIYNDDESTGAVGRLSISNVNQLNKETMDNLIEKHNLLVLPRVSSQRILDTVCPVSSRSSRTICLVLPVVSGTAEEIHVEALREYVKEHGKRWAANKVTFSYVYVDKQAEWIKPFLERRKGDVSDPARDVLAIWRMEYVKAKFAWLENVWTGRKQQMDDAILTVIDGKKRLDETTRFVQLNDEYGLSWFTKWSRAMWRTVETAWFYVSVEDAYVFLSVLGTIFFIVFIGRALQSVQEKDEKKKKPKQDGEWHPDDPKMKKNQEGVVSTRIQRIMSTMRPLMHELRAETYYGMIRLLKPGCRSLVVLVDEQNKEKLLQQFAQYIYPIRGSKTFSFGYLIVDKNLSWFRKLLEHTLPLGQDGAEKPEAGSLYEKLKSINPRQTVGTVLSLCGWKLYFSIYHPKHAESSRRHFLGFDTDDDLTESDEDRNDEYGATREEKARLQRQSSLRQINVENVLNGFPNWLDRLLEGSIRRYYIPEWPDNLK